MNVGLITMTFLQAVAAVFVYLGGATELIFVSDDVNFYILQHFPLLMIYLPILVSFGGCLEGRIKLEDKTNKINKQKQSVC